ncbi:hypothetical protein HYC85_000441 [Camellia sinensis]|uniref:Uncharacterized protein n=1 Tax=Camellia sinensis TaxID=4442 RepID=A0A7J7I2I7_CAMSI|nr:hypothetical protein HYC85_000441 [Camellia sinensis]
MSGGYRDITIYKSEKGSAGVRKASGTGNTSTGIQVPNMMKDIHMCMLSDDNFSSLSHFYIRPRKRQPDLSDKLVMLELALDKDNHKGRMPTPQPSSQLLRILHFNIKVIPA